MIKIRLFILPLLWIHGSAAAQVSENVTFTHEGLVVNATFAHPGEGGPFPAVLLMPGTGANDRDVTLPLSGSNAECLYPGLVGQTLKPFRDLSNALVAGGFAVLRYDKIEYTHTTPAAIGEITFNKLWMPALSALEMMRSRPEVDEQRISLVAHSEGSTLAPHVALIDGGVAAIVSLAGPRAPLDTLIGDQMVHIAQTCGGDVAAAQTQGQQIRQYFAMVRAQQWPAGTPALFGVEAPVWYDYTQVADAVSANYAQADVPVLFLGMDADFNVPPSELQRFQNELGDQAEYGSFPGINHFLTTGTDPVVAGLVSDSVVSWLTNTMLTVGVREHWPLEPLRATATAEGIWIEGMGHGSNEITIYDARGRVITTTTMRSDGLLPWPVAGRGMLLLQVSDARGRRTARVIHP